MQGGLGRSAEGFRGKDWGSRGGVCLTAAASAPTSVPGLPCRPQAFRTPTSSSCTQLSSVTVCPSQRCTSDSGSLKTLIGTISYNKTRSCETTFYYCFIANIQSLAFCLQTLAQMLDSKCSQRQGVRRSATDSQVHVT
jgi:hypothetical protein